MNYRFRIVAKIFLLLMGAIQERAACQTIPAPVNEQRMESLLNDGEAGPDESRLTLTGGLQIDLNGQDLSVLQTSGLMTQVQVAALQQHRNRFGRLLAPEELQVIPGFEAEQVRIIRPYVYCGEPALDDGYRLPALISSARQELLVRHRRVLQDREGFGGDGRYPFYAGDPNQVFLRYRCHSGQLLSAGVTLEKDAGEQWLDRNNGGRVDFFSWHLFLRPHRLLKLVAVGDYQVQFGQGLVAWRGLSLGKGAEISAACRLPAGITPYSAAAESGFYRGLAVSLGRNAWQTDLWLSYNRLDASLFRSDSVSGSLLVGSISETGLHRTFSESLRRAALGSFVAGAHLQWKKENLIVESTTVAQQLEHALWPGVDVYERFDASGRSFLHTGLACRYLQDNVNFYGETAIGREGLPSICGGLVMIPHPGWALNMHFRHFPAGYRSLQADAFREGSRTSNESGWLSGITWQPVRVIRFFAANDRYRFSWLRYTTSAPAIGNDWLFQCTYTPNRTTSCYVRLRTEARPVDVDGERTAQVRTTEKINIRFNMEWSFKRSWEWQARVEWTRHRLESGEGRGALFFQEIRCKPMGKPWSFAVRMTIFNTDSYDERIYTYEQDMAGAFSLPAMAGVGNRAYVLFRYRIAKDVDFWLRYSVSKPSAASGRQSGYAFEPRDEIKTQLRWKF